jgi:hypothetical protein
MTSERSTILCEKQFIELQGREYVEIQYFHCGLENQ